MRYSSSEPRESRSNKSKTIYLVRHGAISSRYDGRFIGRTDVPLSPKGRRQAVRLSNVFLSKAAANAACVSSPLRRALATARLAVTEPREANPTAKRVGPGLRPRRKQFPGKWLKVARPKTIQIWRELREMDFGRWEGLNFDEIYRGDPVLVDQWAKFSPGFRFPRGEGLRPFIARLNKLARRLIDHPANELMVVSHGGVIRSLLCLWTGKPLHRYPEILVQPGSLSVVRVRKGKPRVISINGMN